MSCRLVTYENRLRSLEAAKVEAKEKIANCGRPITDFDTTYRTAMQFLESPCKLWTFGDLADKRAALKLTFEGRIRYNREEGFRTAETAIPFSIFNGLDGLESDDSEMVPLAGLEPALLAEPHFECGASTNFTTGARRLQRGASPKAKRRFLPSYFLSSFASVLAVALP